MNKYWEKSDGWYNSQCRICGKKQKGDENFHRRIKKEERYSNDYNDESIIVTLCDDCFSMIFK